MCLLGKPWLTPRSPGPALVLRASELGQGGQGFMVWAGWPSDAALPGVCRGGSSFQLMAILSHCSGLTAEGHLLCSQHSLKLG